MQYTIFIENSINCLTSNLVLNSHTSLEGLPVLAHGMWLWELFWQNVLEHSFEYDFFQLLKNYLDHFRHDVVWGADPIRKCYLPKLQLRNCRRPLYIFYLLQTRAGADNEAKLSIADGSSVASVPVSSRFSDKLSFLDSLKTFQSRSWGGSNGSSPKKR